MESSSEQDLTSRLDLEGTRELMVTEKACGRCSALQGKRKQPNVLLVRARGMLANWTGY